MYYQVNLHLYVSALFWDDVPCLQGDISAIITIQVVSITNCEYFASKSTRFIIVNVFVFFSLQAIVCEKMAVLSILMIYDVRQ